MPCPLRREDGAAIAKSEAPLYASGPLYQEARTRSEELAHLPAGPLVPELRTATDTRGE